MQGCNEFTGPLVAPSPIIPTYRPSSQASKRCHSGTMSTLTPKHQQYLAMVDDTHPADTVDDQSKNENVAELIRIIQTHSSQQASSQATGAREMIKAGQRRLKLALRNKKPVDPKTKAEDASRQILALQQQGSRRDVESIGQPWLADPLEDREMPDSKELPVSSLNLRELTELVEAAVSFSPDFENINPPPYQLPTEWDKPQNNDQLAKQDITATSVSRRSTATETLTYKEPNAPRSISPPSRDGCNTHNGLPILHPQLIEEHDGQASDDKLSPEDKSLSEARPKGVITSSANPPVTSASQQQQQQQALSPPTPSLKLFPDPMSPRISSKGALRIAASSRSSTPNGPPSTAPSPQQSAFSVSSESSNNRDTKSFPMSNIKSHEKNKNITSNQPVLPQPRNPPKELASSPIFDRFPLLKNSRRPTSLPMGTIEAFPLPAPMRSLPSLPETVPGINVPSDKRAPPAEPMAHTNSGQLILSPPFDNVPGSDSKQGSSNNSPSNSITSSPTQKKYSTTRLVLGGKNSTASHSSSTETAQSSQHQRPTVRGGKSRAERVHSLKMKDLSASRLYLNGSENARDTEEQPSETHSSPQTAKPDGKYESRAENNRKYRRKVASGPPSPPPLSPPPCDPPRHPPKSQSASRRYCTSPVSSSVGLAGGKPCTLLGSGRSSRLGRSNSTKSGKTASGPKLSSRSETPLPSSDDEKTAGDIHKGHPPRLSSGKRRRAKPAPIIIDEPVHRGRTLKKYQSHGNMTPLTPQGQRRLGQEKVAHAAHSSNAYITSFEDPGHRRQESKPDNSLEGRIEHLERQNKILQAALLAALDVGVKQDLSSILGASTASLSTPPLTGRSSSSTTHASSSEEQQTTRYEKRRSYKIKTSYRPESWIASPDSFGCDSYVSGDSANARELEDMIEEFDLDWMSDKSGSPVRKQETRIRF